MRATTAKRKRNPGRLGGGSIPDFASLHPGHASVPFATARRQRGHAFAGPARIDYVPPCRSISRSEPGTTP
jgi:hypothetical protein